jgi:hypothetical protein
MIKIVLSVLAALAVTVGALTITGAGRLQSAGGQLGMHWSGTVEGSTTKRATINRARAPALIARNP